MPALLTRRSLLSALLAMPALVPTRALRAAQTPKIATSMPILQDIVANIAGGAAEVFSIMPANADPHTWEPTPEDMVRLTGADGFIFFDTHLEPFVETGGWSDIIQQHGIPQLQITDHVTLLDINEGTDHGDHSHNSSDGDPHIWLDPLTVLQAVPAIAALLAEVDEEHAAIYHSNADTYVHALEELHTDLETSLAVIPTERRKLLVFHDAWGYFAARYHFEIIGVVLENPDAEVSARQLVDLLTIIDENNIHVVFAEPQFNTTVLNVLADEGDIEIATLLTDTFTDDVTTYLDLMRFNRDQLVKYLA